MYVALVPRRRWRCEDHAVGNYLYCSKIGGIAEPELPKISDTEPKDKLVAARVLVRILHHCASETDDSNKSEMLAFGANEDIARDGYPNAHRNLERSLRDAGRVPAGQRSSATDRQN